MAAAGHELAVHGWEHDCLAMLRPGRLAGQLARSRDVVEDVSGARSRWYRPPYGVMTGEGLYAARRAGLRDGAVVRRGGWTGPGSATPESIVRTGLPVAAARRHRAAARHRPDLGARVVASAPSSRPGLLLDRWAALEVPVGPLARALVSGPDPRHAAGVSSLGRWSGGVTGAMRGDTGAGAANTNRR